jgi:uncharacterized protein YndB with AHSA1/START domain
MSTAGFDYAITRTLDAPVDKVWAAWTNADSYAQWASAEQVVFDVRTGGAWSSVMVIPGGAHIPLTGNFAEVVPNKRLVVGMNVPGREEPVLMALDLTADGDRTEITLAQTVDTAENRDQAEQGSNMLLDSLTGFLAAP